MPAITFRRVALSLNGVFAALFLFNLLFAWLGHVDAGQCMPGEAEAGCRHFLGAMMGLFILVAWGIVEVILVAFYLVLAPKRSRIAGGPSI